MRTQIAKTWYLPAEYIPHTFWLVPPPPFPQVDGGGCYREKFFYFSDFVLEFYFFQNPNFDSLSFARYSSSNFSLCIISHWFSLWISIFSFTLRFLVSIIILDSVFFRFYISTRFYSLNITRINFDLFQHCRFYALTLQLFISSTLLLIINKHLCLCEFVLCLFWLF